MEDMRLTLKVLGCRKAEKARNRKGEPRRPCSSCRFRMPASAQARVMNKPHCLSIRDNKLKHVMRQGTDGDCLEFPRPQRTVTRARSMVERKNFCSRPHLRFSVQRRFICLRGTEGRE